MRSRVQNLTASASVQVTDAALGDEAGEPLGDAPAGGAAERDAVAGADGVATADRGRDGEIEGESEGKGDNDGVATGVTGGAAWATEPPPATSRTAPTAEAARRRIRLDDVYKARFLVQEGRRNGRS
ncbi:hypothetical protein [Streptomyces sp. G-G2]|uniref:hypothetical protein n=1 Tax=Streptomyces sp. G-G2 TaxID=3046201 RepID=UPI0024B92E4C|nr:hypothetical protein [Streptomyces sp. G-G2]MDJ0383688.1 hypothetical protein [Streptomyces sp. G-G2]